MADTDREVTREEIEAMAAKLGPAIETLTQGESEILALILGRAAQAEVEVSGFGSGVNIKFKVDSASATAWANPLSAQLAGAAGLGSGLSWHQKDH